MELLKNQAPGEELSLLIQPARRFWDAGFADISQSCITGKPAGDPWCGEFGKRLKSGESG